MSNKYIFPIKFVNSNIIDRDYITFIVNMTNACNYMCKYCCESCTLSSSSNTQFIDCNVLFTFFEAFKKQHYDKKLKISLYGGEPTLHPQLFDFCKKVSCYDNEIYLEVFSNFSSDVKFYQQLLANNVKLILTFHNVATLPYMQFFEKLSSLDIKQLNNVIVNIMYESDNTKNALKLLDLTKKYYVMNNANTCNVILKLVRDTSNYTQHYTCQQLDEFISVNSQYSQTSEKLYTIEYSNGKTSTKTLEDLECTTSNFYHWLCNAGCTSYYVNVNGKIYPCVTNFYYENVSNRNMSIGNIQNNQKLLPCRQTLCMTKCCTNYDTDKFKIFNL